MSQFPNYNDDLPQRIRRICLLAITTIILTLIIIEKL